MQHESTPNVEQPTRDLIGPGLRYLFCGINPGMYSAVTGFHFARPGNRFWPTLYRAGFTPRLLRPAEERELLQYGCGITSIVQRATATAAELAPDELRAGAPVLVAKIARYQPQVLAVLGISAYRVAFERPKAVIGRQPEPIGTTTVWVLPNPSGLNAHYSPAALAELFTAFRHEVEAEHGPFSPPTR